MALRTDGSVDKKKLDRVYHTFRKEIDIYDYLGIPYVEPENRIKFHLK